MAKYNPVKINPEYNVVEVNPVTGVIEITYPGIIGPQGPSGSSQPFVSGSGNTFTTTSSLEITGSVSSTEGFTGSLYGTASWAESAISASYFSGSISNAVFATSASYASSSTSASYALTASFALNAGTQINTGSFVTTSSFNAFTSSYNTGSFTGSFTGSVLGTSSWSINSITASSADQFNVRTALTASGLKYPTVDNGEFSFIQTDGNGNLTLQYVNTIYEIVQNGEATQITKGTPLYVSGSSGAVSIVYRADAGNPAKMPVIYIAADNIDSGNQGRGIVLGLITGVNTTGYPAGTEIFVGVGGGWTSIRPTGSAIVQVLGIVTKEGNGGQGIVLNPGPANLPNLAPNSVWVGNSGSLPTATLTSSLNVNSASFASTASLAPNYTLLTTFNNYTGSARTGSFTGSFTGSVLGTSSWSVSSSQAISASFSLTASFALNAGTQINTSSFVTTSSFNSYTQSINSFTSSYNTGSFTGSFTGSVLGTSSWSVSASQAISSSRAISSSFALTASFALNAGTTVNTSSFVTTSSFNVFTQSINNFTSSYNTGSFTGSFTGSLLGTASQSITSSLPLQGIVTASATNTTITFTKGDGSTFNVTVSQSGSVATSSYAFFAETASLAPNYTLLTTFNNYTGSARTGSFTGSFTGSVLGTSSWSISSSQAISSSFATSASFAPTNTTGSFTGSFTGSLLGTSSYANNALSASFALTASFALNTGTQINTSSFVTTSSFNEFTQSVNNFTSSYNTGSFTGSFTGSLLGTASWAQNVISASWAPTNTTGSFTGSFTGSLQGTSSWAISSSQALTASFYDGNVTSASYASSSTSASFSTTSSLPLRGIITASAANTTITFTRGDGSTFDVTVSQSGSVATSSYAFFAETASLAPNYTLLTTFNNYTGSARTGSFTGSFTGSLLGTSSWAISSSQAISASFALTASFALNTGTQINTSSFVTTSSFNSYTQSINSFTSSYNTGSFTGSFTGSLLGTSSWAVSSSQATSASFALTASFALNAGTTINTGSFVTTSSFNSFTSSINSFTASYNTGSFTGSFTGSVLGTSSWAVSASQALTASFYGGSVISASYASSSTSASYAATASLAPNYITITTFNNFTSSYNTGSFTGSFTGSVLGTSSWSVSSSQAISSSFALTSSFALNAGTTVDTGSFVTTSSFNSYTQSINNFTSSYNTGSFTGSFTGSLLGTSSYSTNALTASYALNAPGGSTTGSFTGSFTGSLLGTASYATNALSASWAPPSPSSLNNWTEQTTVLSSISSSVWLANGIGSNINAVLQPKGNGSIIAQSPDGTSVGGVQRGAQSVDLQLSRVSQIHVVAGANSFLGSGINNRVAGNYSFLGSGEQSLINSSYSFIGGGRGNNQSLGSDYGTIGGGRSNSIDSGSYSTIIGGFYGRTSLWGMQAYSTNRFSSPGGDSQEITLQWLREITGTGSAELFLDGSNQIAIVKGQVPVYTNYIWHGEVDVMAVCSVQGNGTVTAGEVYSNKYKLVIRTLNTTTDLVGSIQEIGTPISSSNMNTATFSITPDDTRDCLEIDFNPPSTAGTTTVFRTNAVFRGHQIAY